MKITQLLRETADRDRDLIQRNKELQDDPDISRDLDFILYARTEENARLVHDVVANNGYGVPSVQELADEKGNVAWRLTIVIHAPARADIVGPISGFMACLSEVYDLEYDGWGCVIQKQV